MKYSLLLTAVLLFTPCVGAQDFSSALPSVEETAAETAHDCSLSAMELLPGDTECFIAAGHFDAVLPCLQVPAETRRSLQKVESWAVGLSADGEASLRAMLPLLHVAEAEGTESELAFNWASLAHELPARTISRQYAQHREEDADKAITALEQWHPSPVYAVVTLRPEAAGETEALRQHFVEELSGIEGAEPVTHSGWQGVRLHLPADALPDDNLSVLQKVRLAEAVKRVSLCVMCTVRERSLVVAVCADPAEAQPAVSPISSLAAADSARFIAARKGVIFAASVSPVLQNLYHDAALQSMRSLSGLARGVFKTLAEEDAPARELYERTVSAIAALQAQAEGLCPPVDAPATLLLREDGDYHWEWTSDASGLRFHAAEGTMFPADEATILSIDCDPTEGPRRLDIPAVLRAAETIIEGTAETLNNEHREQVQQMLMQYRLFASEQDELESACRSLSTAFDGKWTLTADGKGLVPASLTGGSPAHMLPLPRVALRLGVRHRDSISAAWEQLLSTMDAGVKKLGTDVNPLRELPLSSTQENDITLHSLALPMCSPDFSPSVAVSNRSWVSGSSAALCSQIAAAPLSAPAAQGRLTFRFRPTACADLLQRMAKEDAQFAEAAETATRWAADIRDISGEMTTTAEDDLLHLRVDIRLQRKANE